MRSGVFADYKIFACNSNMELANEISGIMGKPLGKATVTKFSDGEISVNIWETVRGLDVYIIQSTCSPVNDNLMELLIMIEEQLGIVIAPSEIEKDDINTPNKIIRVVQSKM